MRCTLGFLLAGLSIVACVGNSSNGSDTPTDTGGGVSGDGDSDGDGDVDGDTDSDTDSAGDTDLWPDAWSILGTRCGSPGSCHNRSSGSGGLSLPSDDEALSKSNATSFSNRIRSAVSSGEMPVGGTLSSADRKKVLDWIDSL